ncbi:hypothetical protein RD792_002449 [Penstemon davidsonii]|uniref:Eukaryotic translation initiation factor 3 subunit J n=1 Tax=Penstemon davidsonii TaxID=160366 RepID=A0ABR0DS88_9LAMI|nr:hypothetical protein RD792_002449 [Penstemon davidsonii]
MSKAEDEPAPVLLKKEQPKSNWDDEDLDDNEVKDSWEDDDEPAPAPKAEPPPEKAPKKAAAKPAEKKGKGVEPSKEAPIDPIEEKLRQQRLVEEADYKSTAELFAKKSDENTLDNFIPKSESDFAEYAELVAHKLRLYEKSYHYIGLLKAVMRLSLTSLKGADAKEVASSVTAIANEKIKAEKEANAGKKKTGGKKKQLHIGKPDDDVVADTFDDFDDYDFIIRNRNRKPATQLHSHNMESQRSVPFQLQFDKSIASQIKIAEWNPEKDLLAMVTEDSKLILHRFNWQRLWTSSPGKCITSICWRPDGKAIALGLEDGSISLHDVEDGNHKISTYEDRTARFFPHAPRVPRMPGLVSGDSGFMDESDGSYRELFDSSHQQFNILCSGDKDGNICFSIFGIFPIGRVNIHNLDFGSHVGNNVACQLMDAFICKVALSYDLCHIIVLCSGVLNEAGLEANDTQMSGSGLHGIHCLVLDSSIFWKRKNELHQVALQASNVEHLIEVIRESLSVMSKQWSDAMHTYHEKFNALSSLIIDHGLDSTPQEEFLSLLGGARTSPPVHQFLVNSLGEAGLKKVTKAVCGAGKELQTIVLNHLQPAAEIIGFRMGELRGLSKWRARYRGIGLDENLIDNATEEAGMFLVQVERFSRVLSSVVQQASSNSGGPFLVGSELVIIFLKFLYDQDPVGLLLETTDLDHNIEVDLETKLRIRELAHFGGFPDSEYLERTFSKEFQQLESCFKEALEMPLTTVSRRIFCKDLLPLFPIASSLSSTSSYFPASVSYYQEASDASISRGITHQRLTDYTSFIIPDETFPNVTNCIGISRGILHDLDNLKDGHTSLEAVLLRVPDGYQCVDLSLYKDEQILLLLNEVATSPESSGNAYMMIMQAADLPFVSIPRSTIVNSWNLRELQDSIVHLQLENEKVREIAHSVVAPFAVSASRGVACVFAARKRALVYILEEDEDEITDSE